MGGKAMNSKAKSRRSNRFSAYGWFLIIFCVILQMISAGAQVTGLNLTIEYFVGAFGWNQATLLLFNSIAGYVAIIFYFLLAWMMHRIGSKWFLFATLLIGGGAFILWGNAHTLFMYFIGSLVFIIMANAFGTIGTSNLVAIYYPRRKGVVMGWTTMGINFADIFWLPILSGLMAGMTLGWSYTVIGIFLIILGIVAVIFIANKPEDIGRLPDEGFVDKEAEELEKELALKAQNISFRSILKTPSIWLIGIIFGLQYMCATGVFSQALVYMLSEGVAQADGILIMSLVAIAGCLGSYAWGWIDGKIGTKKAVIIYIIMIIVAIVAAIFMKNSFAFAWISGIILFGANGAGRNLLPSYVGTIYGRWDYPAAYQLMGTLFMMLCGAGVMIPAFFPTYTVMYIFDLVVLVIALILAIISKDKFIGKPDTEETGIAQ